MSPGARLGAIASATSRTLLLSSGAVSPAPSAAATTSATMPSRPAFASPPAAVSSSGATPIAR